VTKHGWNRFAAAAIYRVQIGATNSRQGYFDEALSTAKLHIQVSLDNFKRVSSAVKHGDLCFDHALYSAIGLPPAVPCSTY
jgi:hypothetical protein